MTANPVAVYFNHSVVRSPIEGEAGCNKSLSKRLFDVASAAFSGIGNWPFYGVAASFGNAYSRGFGSFLGACEFGSYFLFRIRNFEEIRQKFFSKPSPQEAAMFQAPLGNLDGREVQASSCSRWREAAIKTASACLGLIAQFPIMVLVYYGNDENLAYPIITGVCEGSFTILSLLLSFQSASRDGEVLDPELQDQLVVFSGQIDRFLEELPARYEDPAFAAKIERMFADDPELSEEQRGNELLRLILEARGLPIPQAGVWDPIYEKIAKGLGVFITAYLTAANGAVTFKGVKKWKEDQTALASLMTILVSAANVKLLWKCCVDSSQSYYEGIRDLARGRFKPSLAFAMSPVSWIASRIATATMGWFSFGTTAISVRDYIPVVGNALIVPAPVSSAFLLRESLNGGADEGLVWARGKCDAKAKKFAHLQGSLSQFKEKMHKARPEYLREFFASMNLERPQPRPRALGPETPLLEIV